MVNNDNNIVALTEFFKEAILKDCYLLKNWEHDFFDIIIDIGANVGVFSLCAGMRNIGAKVFAYEPCKETFNFLVNNTSFIPHIKCFNNAFGDGEGEGLYFYDTGWSGSSLFLKKEERHENCLSYAVNSVTLSSIFEEHNISINNNYYIKMDCEGGERFLLGDKKAIDIIKGSGGSGIEVHFQPHGKWPDKNTIERYRTFPTWQTYNEWIYDNFNNTHEIIYHCSNKWMGSGVYVLIAKE